MYLVISVKIDSLPANTKISGIDPFVANQSAIFFILGRTHLSICLLHASLLCKYLVYLIHVLIVYTSSIEMTGAVCPS